MNLENEGLVYPSCYTRAKDTFSFGRRMIAMQLQHNQRQESFEGWKEQTRSKLPVQHAVGSIAHEIRIKLGRIGRVDTL